MNCCRPLALGLGWAGISAFTPRLTMWSHAYAVCTLQIHKDRYMIFNKPHAWLYIKRKQALLKFALNQFHAFCVSHLLFCIFKNLSTPEGLCWNRAVSQVRGEEMVGSWIYHLEAHSRKHKRVHSHTCNLIGRHIETHLHLLMCYFLSHSCTGCTHTSTHTIAH